MPVGRRGDPARSMPTMTIGLRCGKEMFLGVLSAFYRPFKKIKELEKENKSNEIKLKIKNYQTELDKITKMFPDGFFDIEN